MNQTVNNLKRRRRERSQRTIEIFLTASFNKTDTMGGKEHKTLYNIQARKIHSKAQIIRNYHWLIEKSCFVRSYFENREEMERNPARKYWLGSGDETNKIKQRNLWNLNHMVWLICVVEEWYGYFAMDQDKKYSPKVEGHRRKMRHK